MKVLNLYAGIGGNRKLWTDVEVTAVELNPKTAEIYKIHFPMDTVIVADAHEYLPENYKRFDFIWSSPPCPSHSRIRNIAGVGCGQNEPIYPDLKLYEEIIFLRQCHKSSGVDWDGKYCVENVISYYKPLMPPKKWLGITFGQISGFVHIKQKHGDTWKAMMFFRRLKDSTMLMIKHYYEIVLNLNWVYTS